MINTIKNSWTYNHKTLIIALALAVAHVYPLIEWPTLQADTITYTKTATITPYSLDDEINRIALELYEQNRANDLERYRLDAIAVLNEQLQDKVYLSPHIDYDKLKDRYGY